MKACKFYQTLERHPYLRFLLKTGSGVDQTMKPKHVHFIAVRPIDQIPRETFSSIKCDQGENSGEFWVDLEEWEVIFRIREDVERGRDPYHYCRIPFTEIDSHGDRVFHRTDDQQDARDMGFTPNSNARAYIEKRDKFYREEGHVTPEFVAVVNIRRSHGIRYSTFAPARVVIYQ